MLWQERLRECLDSGDVATEAVSDAPSAGTARSQNYQANNAVRRGHTATNAMAASPVHLNTEDNSDDEVSDVDWLALPADTWRCVLRRLWADAAGPPLCLGGADENPQWGSGTTTRAAEVAAADACAKRALRHVVACRGTCRLMAELVAACCPTLEMRAAADIPPSLLRRWGEVTQLHIRGGASGTGAGCSRAAERLLTAPGEVMAVGVERLTLTRCCLSEGGSGSPLALLRALPRLAHLELRACHGLGQRALPEALAGSAGLTSLAVLDGQELPEYAFDAIARLSRLRRLSLGAPPPTDTPGRFSALAGLRSLALLQLTVLPGELTVGNVAALAACRASTALDISTSTFHQMATDEEFAALGASAPPNLTSLSCGWCHALSADALAALAPLGNLRRLELRECGHGGDAHLAALRPLTGLTTLTLAGWDWLSDAGLSALRALSSLAALHLVECPVLTPAAGAELAALPALRELALSFTQPTPMSNTSLFALTSLTSLELGPCAADIAKLAAQLAGMLGLRRLCLISSGDMISAPCLAAALSSLTNLRHLTLSDTPRPSPHEMAAELTSLPQLATLCVVPPRPGKASGSSAMAGGTPPPCSSPVCVDVAAMRCQSRLERPVGGDIGRGTQ